MTSKLILLSVLLFSFQVKAFNKTIYGEDNRLDFTEIKNVKKESWALATAAMIPSSLIRDVDDQTVRIKAKMLSQIGICEYEKFSRQLVAADCSGFLIAPDIIATAGHCVRSNSDCSYYRWVFDYRNSKTYKIGRKLRVSYDKVYACKEVIVTKLNRNTNDDFALIRLDREVLDRRPLLIRTTGAVNENDPLAIIGYPSGLPLKYAGDAKVSSNDESNFFLASLDAFQGNSGSAVINEKTGLVEGILVRGNEDYHYERRKGKRCLVPSLCSEQEGCEGEAVTRISELLPYL